MTARLLDGPAMVLGASGFIGRWVVRELTRRGTPVIAVVRNASAAMDVLDRWAARADIAQADLNLAGTAAALVALHRPATVFNLAGYGVDRNERDPMIARRMNGDLVAEVAGACAPSSAWPGATFVHTGSALEYGATSGALRETGPVAPTTVYGTTKLAGTRHLASVAALRGTRAVTARLFTVFGDGEHSGRLFPSLLGAATATVPLDLTDGRQQRDFAWVQDVAEALVKLAVSSFDPGEVVNLASGQMHEVGAFVRAVAAHVGIPAERLRFGALPTRAEEMTHEGVSVERIKQLLGQPLPGDLAGLVARAAHDAQERASRR